MDKMWKGRTDGNVNAAADELNRSIRVDSRMYKEDIEGSLAHAAMLAKQGIISPEAATNILEGLRSISDDIESGALAVSRDAEDIHMFVEQELTDRIGEDGKKLHTARSRNDQVAMDLRLYLRRKAETTKESLKEVIEALCDQARTYRNTIMPGYTHLQRAQPVTFGHHLLAYAWMFLRDIGRLKDAVKRMNLSPSGCCALAGTTYDIDRIYEAQQLGFDDIVMNSLDGVSDRDFAVEMLSDLALIMTHLSRFGEEIVLWSSFEFSFIELDDAFTTGSSVMPQKKNPDMAELIRGKTGRVYGDLMNILTVLKGLPLSYNKDMQEDKEAVFDAIDTVNACLKVLCGMVSTLKARPEKMKKATSEGFINATDLADYLVGKGMAFREAYHLTGRIVAKCIEEDTVLEKLPLRVYEEFSPLFKDDLYETINPDNCLARRAAQGGPTPSSVDLQIERITQELNK